MSELTRVLLIEDDQDDYLITKGLFGELAPGAYHLDRVADYESAMQAFERCEHDVYLIDYRLGGHTGLEVLAEARKRGCRAPMIMLTGQHELEIDMLAMQAGADDYLVKDHLDSVTLERSMRYTLVQKRLEEEIRRANVELEERVKERTAELAKLNAALEAEIAERTRVEAALREADQRKDQFLALLAHELRNPLSPLTAASQLIALEPGNMSQVREMGIILSRQVEQLKRLIDDLLDVSRISSGKLQLRREPVALSEAIAAALDVSRPIIDASSHMLEVFLPPEPLVIDGDKVRLAQVVGNLLINAAKYTPKGGRIDLEVRRDEGQAVICVRDNGIGIPPEMLPKVFGLFTQVDTSNTRAQGGLGIGLPLAKTLVQMHGGMIQGFSGGAGKGSEFTVKLPLTDAARLAARPAPRGYDLSRPRSRLRVLVVDDNYSACYLLSRLLEKLGQEVHISHSANEALAKAPVLEPDVVISDIAMPDVSGYELAARIRALTLARQPILIALTGYGQETDRQAALAAGFDDHLTKPIGLPALKSTLEGLGQRIDHPPAREAASV
jgi:signal transduction histidine kinase